MLSVTLQRTGWTTKLLGFVAVGVFILLVILANLPFEYSSIGTASRLPKSNCDFQSLAQVESRLFAAGWPIKFYVRRNYEDAPKLSCLDVVKFGQNICIWLVVGAACYVIFGWKRPREKKNKGRWLFRQQFGTRFIFILTALIALPLANWRLNASIIAEQKKLASDILSSNGIALKEVVAPTFLKSWMPSLVLDSYTRITVVVLERPKTELLKRVAELQFLKILRIGGGDYDLKCLDRLYESPILTELRVSGRILNESAFIAIAKIKQLEKLNLMRTNVDVKRLAAFGAMPRLKYLNLVHTDVRLKDLNGKMDCLSRIVELHLPHPPEGESDQLELDSLPELESIRCVEFDEQKNAAPVGLAIRNCPKLKQISLDSLQKFDLDLTELPNLQKVVSFHLQYDVRVNSKQGVPDQPWIRRLNISAVPRLALLGVYAPDLESIQINSKELQRLNIAMYHGLISTGASFKSVNLTSKDVPKATRQRWLNDLGKCNGPIHLDFAAVPLEQLDFTPLAENKSIRSLDLSGSGVSPKQLLELQTMSQLEVLQLKDVQLDNKTIQSLLANLKSLKKINVDPKIGKLRLESIPELEALVAKGNLPYLPLTALRLIDIPKLVESFDFPPNLSYLYLENMPSLVGLSFRSQLPKAYVITGLRDLRYFAAGGTNLREETIDEILNCEKLEKLTLAYTNISSSQLARIGQLTELQYLALPGCAVDDDVVSNLGNLKKLKSLILDDTSVSDQGMSQLPLGQLTRLSVQRTKVSSEILGLLAQKQAEQQGRLRWLGVGGFELSTSHVQSIANLKSLEVLSLRDCTLDSTILSPILSQGMASLSWIQLESIRGDGSALLALAQRTDAFFELQNCEKDTLAMSFLLQSDRLLERESIENMSPTRQIQFQGYGRPSMRRQIPSVLRNIDKGPYPIIAWPEGEIEHALFVPNSQKANYE